MTVQFTRTLSLGDYIAANWLYQRKYWLWSGLLKIYGLGAGLFFLMMLVVTAFDGSVSWSITWTLFLASLLFGVVMMVAMPLVSSVLMLLVAKRNFREMSLDMPTTYEFDEKSFRAANDQGTANLAWDRLYDFVQDRRVLLLRRTRRIFFILPKSQFTSEELGDIVFCICEAGVRER